MSNLASIQKLNYCQRKNSNTGHCSNVASWQVKLCSKKDINNIPLRYEMSYRCDEHKKSGTNSKKVYEANTLDQSFTLQEINNFLKTLLGRNIKSTFHSARWLEVKYLKHNGAVMCFQPITKKWKYVYYYQIESVMPNEQEAQECDATKPLNEQQPGQ